MRQPAIDCRDRLIDKALHLRILGPLFYRVEIGIEGDQGRHEGASVAEHNRLADAGTLTQTVLHRRRGDVLSTRCLEKVLLAVRNPQESIPIELADIARLQPTVDQGFSGGLLIFEVALEHVVAPDEDLTIRRDPQLHPGKRGTDRAETGVPGTVE